MKHNIDNATKGFLAGGMRVMNGFLLAETELAHASLLLSLMSPPSGACILDAGCGIGELARLMHLERPDLDFTLLNTDELQLSHCPKGMTQIKASFDAIPLPDDSVDVVMFNFALCHSEDWLTTLAESRRVLKENGVLFVFDMARRGGCNALMAPVLQANAYPAWQVADVAKRAGFVLDKTMIHPPVEERLKALMPNTYDLVVGDVLPATWRFLKKTIDDPIESAFARHERIGFQFSGGRDSTAALYLLRPYWDRMAIYHLDTGDQFPETIEVVRQVEVELGRPLLRILSDVEAVRRDHGLASDLVPVDNSEAGRLVSGRSQKIIGRYECCYRTLMAPMHRRIQQDGISLLIRGQRDDEYAKPPKRSGDVQDGLELLYPIQSWNGDQVQSYLVDNAIPLAPYYARGARRAPECMGCTAWWDEGRATYLKQYHPLKFASYSAQMALLRVEIDRQYGMLEE